MDIIADWCFMRKLTSLLLGGALVAWMAYLSWPVTADLPVSRQKAVESLPTSKGHRALHFQEAEAYESSEPKAISQPSV